MPKPFKNFKEQINILNNDEKLNIDNDSSYERLLYYLKKFNMQKVIDGYNKPFFQDNNRTKKYWHNVDSNMILDFFDFENNISNLLIKSILKIEVKLNTSYLLWNT